MREWSEVAQSDTCKNSNEGIYEEVIVKSHSIFPCLNMSVTCFCLETSGRMKACHKPAEFVLGLGGTQE